MSELTWRKAIDKVLGASPIPLRYTEIAEQIISQGLRSNIGATPAATVSAQISTSLKNEGNSSPYIRVARGSVALRAGSPTSVVVPKLAPNVPASEETEDQYQIVTSFGMFWRRDAVEWASTPKLLGMAGIGAVPVDFYRQLGIYLLYDGREVVYVGRSTDRPLGRRLYEHTLDRLAVRWDRFSWFGLLPVSDAGELGRLPNLFEAAKLIPALEAILIEAVEPRQNRKRGDTLEDVEFIQKVDPDIEREKAKAVFDTVFSKQNS